MNETNNPLQDKKNLIIYIGVGLGGLILIIIYISFLSSIKKEVVNVSQREYMKHDFYTAFDKEKLSEYVNRTWQEKTEKIKGEQEKIKKEIEDVKKQPKVIIIKSKKEEKIKGEKSHDEWQFK